EAPPNLGPDYTERFRRAFRHVAGRNPDVHLIPFLLEEVAGRAEMNQADGIHPNARGHRRIAEEVWAHLEPLLEREGRR
ncbi:MAG TPA: SGNH/GDSL hydrolase family protein, partial [Longimicrobiales bacterium]|nr:SGNH/GDSL hydrolase family protein [Longimicrobiales bacterium]